MFILTAQPFDSMQYMYNSVQMPLIRCYIQFYEKLDVDRLKQAISSMISQYPILNCKFEYKKRRWVGYSFHLDDYLSIISETNNAGNEDQTIFTLNLESDPPFKVFLNRYESSDSLCIVVSHILCDGRGFIELLYLLAKLYSTPILKQDKFLFGQLIPRCSFDQITQQISFKEKVQILKNKSEFSAKDTQKAIPLTGNAIEPFLVVRTLDQETYLAVRSYAKKHNASVNDVILAVYMRVLHKQFGWSDITLPCPVDLRRFSKHVKEPDKDISIEHNICNLTGNYFCHATITKDTTLEEIIRTVSSQMIAQKTSNHCLKGPIQFHLLYRFLPKGILRRIFFGASPIPVTSYTNLGLIEKEKLHFSESEIEDAYIVTATKQPPYFQISVSIFDDKCTFTSCLYADYEDQIIVKNLMDSLVSELNKCII